MTRPLGKVYEEVCLAKRSGETVVRVAVLLAACLSPILAFAQNDIWKGGTGKWSDSTKWSAGVPSSSSNVLIDNGNGVASSVTIDFNGAQSGNLTIDSDDSVTIVDPSIFTVFGPTIANAGTFSMNATSGAILDISGSVTLKGSGGLTLSNNANNNIMGYGQPSGATFTNQTTIRGAGNIGGNGIGSGNSFINQGTVNANQTTPLTIAVGAGTVTNTGTLEATNGATLSLNGGGIVTNTGGTIHADPSSIVTLQSGLTISGGTLTTSGTGTIQANCCFNDGTLSGVTINGTFQVNDNIQHLGGTITNNGSVQLNSTGGGSAILDVNGDVTLQGSGTLIMSNDANNQIMGYGQTSPASLTNKITIQGAGDIGGNGIGSGETFNNQATINANQVTPLIVAIGAGTVTNTGVLEATNGAKLSLSGSGTLTNTGGTIHADSGSVVSIESGLTVSGGTLTTSGSGSIQANCCFNNDTLNGVTINGAFQVNNNIQNLTGTITNNGPMQLNSTGGGSAILDINGAVTLQGSGTVTLSNNVNNQIMGYGQQNGATLTNKNTIQGAGTIKPGCCSSVINQHIISATQTTPLTINGNFSNSSTGTLKVAKNSAMYITGGLFSNFSGSTLTGGKYMVTGTLGFDGANIVSNAASITLTGTTSQIVNDLNSANALANFATNTTTGSFSLLSGKLINTTVTSGNFSNAGKVTVGVGSGFQISAPPQGTPTYTQTAGTTTVDGVLTATGGVTIQAGKVFGKGTIASTVVSSGSVTAGDSATKAGKLSLTTYTQNSGGSLNVQIGGLTVGKQYSQLAVANGASLNGTLNVTLINNFVPAIGNTFTILTGSAVTGTFATVNGLSINSGEHFTIAYHPTNVTLTVVSGP